MTDRFNSLTVVLERDVRDDDAESLISAIMRFRGVLNVTGNVVKGDAFIAESRVRAEVRKALFKALDT